MIATITCQNFAETRALGRLYSHKHQSLKQSHKRSHKQKHIGLQCLENHARGPELRKTLEFQQVQAVLTRKEYIDLSRDATNIKVIVLLSFTHAFVLPKARESESESAHVRGREGGGGGERERTTCL